MALSNWPAIVDDDGSLIVGTPINKALFDAIRASIEDDVFSALNPTVTGEDIIDEVVAARGSKTTLDERLDVALNEDGTLKTAASLVTATQAGSIVASKNLARNENMQYWSVAEAAPHGWTLSGTGASVTRCGTGLADTTTLGAGRVCAKLTYGSATAKLLQNVLFTDEITDITEFQGKSIVIGVQCKSSTASQASIVIDDGVGTTRGGSSGNGTYHSGNGTVQWLYATHAVSSSATKLDITLEVASSGSAYFGGVAVVFGQIALPEYPVVSVEPRTGVPRVLHTSVTEYKAVTPANNTDTGWTIKIPAYTLRNNGDMLRITGASKGYGSANTTRTLQILLGSSSLTFIGISSVASWTGPFQVFIVRLTATTQNILSLVPYTNQTQSAVAQAAGTADLTTDLTLKIQHATASATDYLSLINICVEYVPAVA